jgi:endonuclease G
MNAMKHISVIALLCLLFTSCTKDKLPLPQQQVTAPATAETSAPGFPEGFESGSKTAYAAANVSLNSGLWNFDEALLGTLATDAKNGSKSVRIRNAGTITMLFDVTDATQVSIAHAKFGSDAASTWQLWYSTDGGSSWSQTGGNVSTNTTSLQTAVFNTVITGTVRFQLRKLSGSGRINIDDFNIETSSTTNPPDTTVVNPADNSSLLPGNPSNATNDIAVPNNYLMERSYYSLSYSRDRGTPNWVAWHVNSADLGSTPRQDDYRSDNTLPAGWYRVQSSSYSGSGFDRGHNCPSGDRTASVAANSSTFLMTNMIPQAPNNNQQTWNNLENYTRDLVDAGNEVYVICGAYGTGGTGSNGGVTNTINGGNVTVPSNVWKVIVVIPNGSNDLSRISTTTRVIAVNTPNVNSINTNWKTYRTSVDAIESATGYDLLSNVPASVQTAIESVVDNL